MFVRDSSEAHALYCHTSISYLIACRVTGRFAVIMNVFRAKQYQTWCSSGFALVAVSVPLSRLRWKPCKTIWAR